MKFRQMCIPVRKSEEEKKEEQQGYDPAHVSISFDADKRVIRIDGDIGEEDGIIFEEAVDTIRDYIPCDEEGNELKDRPEPLDRLEIHINSKGGSVDAALNIVSQIEQLKRDGVEVVSFVKEKSCSAAFLIAIVCSYRIMRKYARLMLHPSWYSIDGYVALTIDVLRNLIKNTDKTWKVFEELVLENTKIDKKLLTKIYRNGEDFYMDSNEALKYGCIDKVL